MSVKMELMNEDQALVLNNTQMVGVMIVILRLVMGWIFLESGLTKLLNPEWSASGYLLFAIPESNPFATVWTALAGNPLIDTLNAWGALLIGISLLLGALVRWSAAWGIVMMLFYWASALHGGLAQGFPNEFGWFFDQHMVYILIMVMLMVAGAGRIWGLDGWIAKQLPFLRPLAS